MLNFNRGILALALAASIFPIAAKAQTIREIAFLNSELHLTQGDFGSPSGNTALLSTKEVSSIRDASISSDQGNRVQNVISSDAAIQAVKGVLSDIEASAASFQSGATESYCAPLPTGHACEVLKQQLLHVTVGYEPGLVGGILSVSVDIRPAFSGIGVTNQPIASIATTESITELAPDKILEVVSSLTEKLSSSPTTLQMAAK